MKAKNNKKSFSPLKLKVESLSFEEYLDLESKKQKKKKAVLTITIDEASHQKLKRLIPEGEVSKFAEKIIKEGLRKLEEKIFREYAKINQDQELDKQIEKLSIS